MKNLKALILLVVSFFIFSGFLVNGQKLVLEKIMSDPALKGLEISEGPDTYVGDDLFLLINGGADMYHEFGCVEVVAYKLSGPGDQMFSVEIYEMTDPGAAFGIWSMNYISTAEVTDPDEMAFIGDTYLQFWKNKYYVTISSGQADETSSLAMIDLAKIISGAISNEYDLPPILDLKTLADNGSQKYIRGNIALSNLYYFNYKDIFLIEEGIYEVHNGLRKITMYYKDVNSANKAWESASEKISSSKKFLDFSESDQKADFKDRKGGMLELILNDDKLLITIADQ